jgi:hypothetical protein
MRTVGIAPDRISKYADDRDIFSIRETSVALSKSGLTSCAWLVLLSFDCISFYAPFFFDIILCEKKLNVKETLSKWAYILEFLGIKHLFSSIYRTLDDALRIVPINQNLAWWSNMLWQN